MKRLALLSAPMFLLALVLPLGAQDKDKCTCAEAKKAGIGWCVACKHGMAYGTEFRSQPIYLIVAGEPAPKSKADVKCKECLKAMETDGICKTCNVAFYKGNTYKSIPAYHLAMGVVADPVKITCEGCKTNLTARKDAFCDKCNAGLVSGFSFKTRPIYDQAVKAFVIFKQAITAKCETCGKAILTDGECTVCKVKYKDGKKV